METVPVSIVIPSYNGIRYMGQLTACLRPYYESGYEVILVEDGSNDGTKEAFLTAFPNATYVWQNNTGVAGARLKGVEYASGTFIQLLDVDDTITEDKLSNQFYYAEAHGMDVVYSDWRIAYNRSGKGTTYGDWKVEAEVGDIITYIFGFGWFPPCAPIIRKSAYLNVGGGDLSLRYIEDYALWLSMAIARSSFGYLPGHFSTYHIYEESQSLTSNFRTQQWWSDTAKVFLDAMDSLSSSNQLTIERLKIGSERSFNAIRNLAKFDQREASHYFKRLIHLNSDFYPQQSSAIFIYGYRWLGYETTEAIAQCYQRVKNSLGFSSSLLNMQLGDDIDKRSFKGENIG